MAMMMSMDDDMDFGERRSRSASKQVQIEEPADVDHTMSIGQRAIKFMQSKSIGTRFGRRLFLSKLGSQGAEILNDSVYMLVEHHYGKERADELERDFLRVVLKAQTAFQNKVFTFADSRGLEEPAHRAIFMVVRMIKPILPNFDEKEDLEEDFFFEPYSEEEIDDLIEALKIALGMWCTTMERALTIKNQEMMNDVIEDLTRPEFIHFVFSSPDSLLVSDEAFREQLWEAMMQTLGCVQVLTGFLDKYCKVSICGKKCPDPVGLFRGSDFCHDHHREHYAEMYHSSGCHHFIDDVENRVFLREYLTSLEDVTGFIAFKLMLLIDDYRAIFSYKLRKHICRLVFEILEQESALVELGYIEEGMFEKIQERAKPYEDRMTMLPTDLLDELIPQVLSKLDEFMPEFKKSSYYYKFVMTTNCPEAPPEEPKPDYLEF